MFKKILISSLLALLTIGVGVIFVAVFNKDETSSATPGHNDHPSSSASTESVDFTNQSEVAIDIKDFSFSQPDIKIKKGTKVTWTNRDSVRHNAMQEHADSSRAHDAPSPSQVKSDVFAGPLLSQNESYSFTFNKPGQISYHCAPHPNMQGKITVVE